MYVDHDRVVLLDDQAAVHRRAVADWWDTYRTGSNAHLIAGTRHEAHTLNRLARQRLTHAGHLTGDPLDVHGKAFQVGDRIVLLQNAPGQTDADTGQPCRVDNGMIGHITHIQHASGAVTLELVNGRHITLDPDYVNSGHVDHGYATTIHKTQGMTCDDIFIVGPNGLYREAAYVALSRARNTAHLYATSRQAADLNEQPHTTGIPLPSEITDPETELIARLHASHASQFATNQAPHLAQVAELANRYTLGQLREHHRRITDIVHEVRLAGFADPRTALDELSRAVEHRRHMHIGGRVNALDWDNVGTIITLNDHDGTATVSFESAAGQTATKTLAWDQIRPIDHPEPAELTDTALAYLDNRTSHLEQVREAWEEALRASGANADDLIVIPAAIEQRRRQLLHQWRATPPDWLTYWLGQRPTDPTGAQVYDTELEHLTDWRDTHHLPATVPGYGPPPDNPQLADEWRQHMDRCLTTHHWLATRPDHTTEPATVISPTDAQHRLGELNRLLRNAPTDQRHIIDAILDSNNTTAAKVAALKAAYEQQAARRDWILEHWPHVIEHHQLTQLTAATPLAHWPTALTPRAQRLLIHLHATSTDSPEPRTLLELDRAADVDNPHRRLRQLHDQLDTVQRQLHDLGAQPGDAFRRQLHDDHTTRLRERAGELTEQIRRLATDAALWNWQPHTPPEILHAIDRRTNHLAHTAITERQPWIEHVTAAWTAHHPNGTVEELRSLIHDVAAHRERIGHDGPDPLPIGAPSPGDELDRHIELVHRIDGTDRQLARSIQLP